MTGLIMRFPKGKTKALTLSYDDGVEQDIRLMEIMDQNGLKGTFNLNSGLFAPEGTVYPEGTIHRRLTAKQVSQVYADSGHEVAVHGLTHPFLEKLPEHMAMWDLLKDRENLETKFHTIIRGMAYPFGTFNSVTVDCLKKAGLVYGRTVISSHSFDIPKDWLRLEATCHHNDPELMNLAGKFVAETPEWNSWLFYLWGHSYEFESNDNWNVIEEFAAFTGGRDDIWYATNIQICDYVQAYNRLEFSVDGSRIYNPTATELYFQIPGNKTEMYRILPGEYFVLQS
ncbi:MAG: polysaccharide deacetylase family protein [Lachnospiraceae bacterium]|nr:polysaccharide deacetylase family protein [Lachnospiraceae bacterium]